MDIRAGVEAIEPRVALSRLRTFPFLLLTWVGEDGYPVSAAVQASIDDDRASIEPPAGLDLPADREISLTGSHIRLQPGYGYDERRHVTMWGRLERDPAGRVTLRPEHAWGWDEAEVPFPEYAERTVGQSRRYLQLLTEETGRLVRPRLALGWLALRATRLPFLSATIVPVTVGLAIAAAHGAFDWPSAVLTLLGAAAAHLGLNVANDVFDTRSGADDANVNPTRYSGGSRVIQYGLVSLREMTVLSAAFYGLATAVGLVLIATRGSIALLAIGVAGIVLSLAYTAPPLKLVYRGLGELTTAIGFGPLMLLGAYVVQTRGAISSEALVASLPIAILVALILYVNEVPDREADARAGKRTLPVLLSRSAVLAGYALGAATAFAIVVGGVVAGLLPVPALVALLAVPLAVQVRRGLAAMYDQPYGLMAVMAVNIRLHLVVGVMLLASYVVVVVAAALAPSLPLFLR
jgi:1,4-dihydroxy-2-naphthoate polyprenyltransferase